MRPTLLVALAALLSLAGCSSSRNPEAPAPAPSAAVTAPGRATRVDGAAARRLVQDGAWLLDVRSPEEYADGHIDGARNFPVDRLEAEVAKLPRDRPLVVYCAVGSRSARAAQILAAAGFDVRNLGKMESW